MNIKEIALANQILEVRVGSHLFGTDTPDSDLDLFGVYMPTEEIIFSIREKQQEVDLGVTNKDSSGRNTEKAVDRKLHDYRKFVRLLADNNPNIMHVLFADQKNILYINGYGKHLLDNWAMFPHKGAHHRFIAYAHAQIHKMKIKPANYKALKEGLKILEGFDDHRVLADVVNLYNMDIFTDNGQGKHVQCGDLHFERGVFVKKARKMIKERLSKATNRTELFTKYGFDAKYASNLIQLLMEGIELMNTGRIQMPLAYRKDIVDIKNGKYTATQIENWAIGLEEDARRALERSSLPDAPDLDRIEKFAVRDIKEHIVQHLYWQK